MRPRPWLPEVQKQLGPGPLPEESGESSGPTKEAPGAECLGFRPQSGRCAEELGNLGAAALSSGFLPDSKESVLYHL